MPPEELHPAGSSRFTSAILSSSLVNHRHIE